LTDGFSRIRNRTREFQYAANLIAFIYNDRIFDSGWVTRSSHGETGRCKMVPQVAVVGFAEPEE
jgi:hypothetical protein